jgi:hypothetical protein
MSTVLVSGMVIWLYVITLDVSHLEAVAVAGFDFCGYYLAVAFGSDTLKAQQTTRIIKNVAVSSFDGVFLTG